MKVGLITTQFAVNFGAILQAYALRKKIDQLGFDCEIINYSPLNRVDGRRFTYSFKNWKEIIRSILVFFNFSYRTGIRQMINYFDLFLTKNCNLSSGKYHENIQLKEKILEYDCFVCGSDQIWNLNLFNDPTFFLHFGDINQNINYIAYAPSITEDLSNDQFQCLAENIKHFSAVSLREENSLHKLSKYTDINIVNVLDPVFLLEKEHWESIEEPLKLKGPFILNYAISPGNMHSRVLKYLKYNYKLNVVDICLTPYNKYKADFVLRGLSPGNFVWLFNNAQYICTSSFHGMVFSIIFKKQFWITPSSKRSSRHHNVLDKIGLSDRLIENDVNVNLKEIKTEDFRKAMKLLNLEKEKSLKFLSNSLLNEN
jgi:hypothetical protein